jgi:hypothetical protein
MVTAKKSKKIDVSDPRSFRDRVHHFKIRIVYADARIFSAQQSAHEREQRDGYGGRSRAAIQASAR